MKVLVLNPPFKAEYGRFSRTSRSPAITRGGTVYYPFWLAYAAGVLDRQAFEVRFIDGPAEGLTADEIIQGLRDFAPELVIIDTSTPSIKNDVAIASLLKKRLPESFILLVGTHPSALPEETLRMSEAINAVAVHEYDYTALELAKKIREKGTGICESDLREIRGLSFRSNGGFIHNPARELIENLDELPFASEIYKKYLKIEKYFFAACDHPMVMIITGRGCLFRCFFCVYPQVFHSRRYRLRSPESIVAEFEYIKKELPQVREIGIEDDTFTAIKKRTIEVCELLIRKKIKIKWYCNVRVDLDLETMKIMKQAGCKLVTVGFESGNQEVLNHMCKGITVEQIRRFVKDSKKAGLMVHGSFMAGDRGETKKTLEETLALAKELNTDSMQFYPLIVYPGTDAYKWAKQNNYIITEDFAHWATPDGGYNCVISLPGLSAAEILDFCNRATREYYLRPRYILMKFCQMLFHPGECKRTIMASKTFFRHLKSGGSACRQ